MKSKKNTLIGEIQYALRMTKASTNCPPITTAQKSDSSSACTIRNPSEKIELDVHPRSILEEIWTQSGKKMGI